MGNSLTSTSPRAGPSTSDSKGTTRRSRAVDSNSLLERTIRRDRWIVAASLLAVTLLAWVYLVRMAAEMGMPTSVGDAVAMAHLRPWDVGDFLLTLWMWVVMMVAMMLPSAAPMILIFARVGRKASEEGHPFATTGSFTAGYLAAWAIFSLGATTLQWALDRAALLSPMMVAASPILGGALLIAAGVYQLSPVKDACLKHCRSPVHFITQRWRRGTGGALRMGLEHGLFCVGCCWALMGLLFFGGVMNFVWIVGIAFFVLIEKVLPRGASAGRLTGGILVLLGLLVIATAR